MYKGKKKKASNRSRILECIYRNAPIARTDIAEETEITPATVTMNVTTLISEGFVKELGEVSTDEGSSGRKRVLIDIIPAGLTASVWSLPRRPWSSASPT